MKKTLTKILPCLLVLLCVFALASCEKNKDKYNYPNANPAITTPGGTFLKLGNKVITNEAVYTRLLQSYGTTELINWMDNEILKSTPITDQADFEKQMNYITYGTYDVDSLTAEEKAEKEKEFKDSMMTQGYETEAEWKSYYELEYKRLEAGKKAYAENEDDFETTTYQNAFDALYQSDYEVVLLTFDSEFEAKKVMQTVGIDTTNLTLGWTKDGKALTAEEIKNAFVNMYELMTGSSDAVKTYKFDDENKANELANISATIASKVGKLSTMTEDLAKSYTHGPLVYGSRYYLALKVSKTTINTYENATEEQKAAVKDYLLENAITSSYLLINMNKAHLAAGLKIYDEGLEVAYKASYDKNYTDAKITEYDAFVTTTDENSSVVAEITVDGAKKTLSAQDLFDRLLEHYGTALSLLYVQEYSILKNSAYNKVINYETGAILDQTTYDTYYASDVTKYKTALEAGEYASSGYPANYGFEHFVRDYLGVVNATDLLTIYGGSLYSVAEAEYLKQLYMGEVEYQLDENGKQVLDEDGNPIVVKTADQAVQDEMQNIFDNFFSSTMVGVYAFYDADLNGVADEMTEEQTSKANELVNAVYESSKNAKYDSITVGLTEIVKAYKLTTVLASETSVWKEYKALGLRLTLVSSTTYTNTSSANEEILKVAKEQWTAVKNYKGEDTSKPDPIGQTLDPGYRSVINSKVNYITSAIFADNSSAFVANNASYRLVVVKATNNTYISTYYKTFKPTLAEYENYLLDDKDENKTPVSSALSTAITTYYKAAITNLTTSTIVNNLIFTDCKALIDNNSVVFTSNELKEKAIALIDYSLSK